jgi:uncharacterized protein (TIGR03382 family)
VRLCVIGFTLATMLGVGAVRAQLIHPQPEGQVLCQTWKGTVRGNDPSVVVTARICPTAGSNVRIQGTFHWDSQNSGWNRRELDGEWQDDRTRLVMHDVRIIEEAPQHGWRFCSVDLYDLRRADATHLEGSYVSRACNDHAVVSLALEGAPASHETPPAPTAAIDPPPAKPGRDQGARRFGCSASRAAGAPGAVPLFMVVALGLVRRARRS